MAENFAILVFALSQDDRAAIATLGRKARSCFEHRDPAIVKWPETRRL